MRRIALSIAGGIAVAFLAGCGAGTAEPAHVWFIAPEDGAVVTGTEVLVQLGAENVEIAAADDQRPGTGHHHIFLNADVTPLGDTIPAGITGIIHLGRGQTEFLIDDLEPGEYRLIAVLADWDHIPLDPPAMDTVRITVVAPPE